MTTQTALAKVAKPIDSLRALFDKATPAIAQVIPAHLTPERILRVTLACVSRTPLLLECTPQSILQGVMLASQLGLDPTGGTLGQGYLVPYRNNKTGKREAQFIPGYRGLIDLARRSGNVDSIHAHPVFQKDRFTYQLGSNPGIDHVPALTDDPGPLVAAYMVAFLKDSAIPQIEIMSREQIDAIRKRSKAKDAGPWVTDFDEMARKTVVRRGAKYLPMSVEFATGLQLQDDAERGEPTDYSTLDIEMPALPADESEPAAQPQTRTQSVKEKLKAAPPAPVEVPQVVDAVEVDDDEYEPTETLPWEEAPLAVKPEPEPVVEKKTSRKKAAPEPPEQPQTISPEQLNHLLEFAGQCGLDSEFVYNKLPVWLGIKSVDDLAPAMQYRAVSAIRISGHSKHPDGAQMYSRALNHYRASSYAELTDEQIGTIVRRLDEQANAAANPFN